MTRPLWITGLRSQRMWITPPGEVVAPERRPREPHNARMDLFDDSTFEMSRDRYKDIVERINEARAAY